MKKYPRRGQTYTLREIETELELRDSPNLAFFPVVAHYVDSEAGEQTIQDSHLPTNLCELPGWENTEWVYLFETDEQIPCFRARNNTEIENLCVIEASTDDYYRSQGHMHVYPKGTKSEQYEPYVEAIHGQLLVQVSDH